MATKEFTAKQKEIVARRMGYDGPMSGFDDFVRSDPALERKYGLVLDKFMARGGVVKKFQTGGDTGSIVATEAPKKPVVRNIVPSKVTETEGQIVSTEGAPEKAITVTGAPAATATTITDEAKKAAEQVTAATAQPEVTAAVSGVTAEQGAVSEAAQVKAQTMDPTDTKVGSVQAAQGVAREVEQVEPRKLEAGELVSGPAVNQAQVEEALAKNEAAQGIVSEDMTVQGQLAKLTTDFELKNPPSWAAGALRSVTATLAQRGLGASSLAGQALIQATLEAALPIASQDAQVFQQMGLQNLSNKQQMAVLSAQQRAQFLGQEFDQAFQTRVLNANKISDIANINFNARQQVALENARLAQSMDLANLSNRQALVMAEAAQIATLETANLNNRQQAAVVNAQAFLQMDIANLSNRQQTALFKAQSIVNSILSDQAAENAARQFNATSTNQVNQFYDNLSSQVKQFNASQSNAMTQFNINQANAIAQFNASQQNVREQFNAENRRIIDQSNAEWRRNISLANTAATNRANELNAANSLQVTIAEYNNLWQKYRDDIEYAWKTGENKLDRENELARSVLSKQATIDAAKFQVEAKKYEALGALTTKVLEKSGAIDAAGKLTAAALESIGSLAKNVLKQPPSFSEIAAKGYTDSKNLINTTWVKPGEPGYGWKYFNSGVAISPSGEYYYEGELINEPWVYGSEGE